MFDTLLTSMDDLYDKKMMFKHLMVSMKIAIKLCMPLLMVLFLLMCFAPLMLGGGVFNFSLIAPDISPPYFYECIHVDGPLCTWLVPSFTG